MSELSKALAAVGESAPEAPATWNLPWGDGYLAKHDPLLAWRFERKHGRALESLALRLARRLAEANAVIAAEGIESDDEEDGTGKEQPR